MKHNLKISIPVAIIVTMIAVIYQRSTGPTYPKKFKIGESKSVKIKLPRSQGGDINAPVELPALKEIEKVTMTYKRYPTKDEWTTVELKKENNQLKTTLPNQPPAGKLTYFLDIFYANGEIQNLGTQDDPIYIRYKGEVPVFVLAPHVICMFLSMLLSVVALVEALFKTQIFVNVGRYTLGCLFFGGMILGPIVQKYAFGVYWAGFPFDHDLTDNKLLIGVLAWLFAVLLTWKKERRTPIVIAAIVLFAVYSIPHSMQGSEFDYEKGKVITDMD